MPFRQLGLCLFKVFCVLLLCLPVFLLLPGSFLSKESLTFGKSALWANIRSFSQRPKVNLAALRQKMPFELKRKQSSSPSDYMLARMFTESMPGCFYKTSVLSNGHLSSNWKILRNLDTGTCCASFRAVLRYLWRFPNERWT